MTSFRNILFSCHESDILFIYLIFPLRSLLYNARRNCSSQVDLPIHDTENKNPGACDSNYIAIPH